MPENKRGYAYIPAGIHFPGHGGLGIYVKYHKHSNSPIRILESAPGHMWLSCPDRDLLLTGHSNTVTSIQPTNYDEYINLSLPHLNSASDFGVKSFMLNYVQYAGKGNSPELRRAVAHSKGQPYTLSDSGGFQIVSGTEDFINPSGLIKWYNTNVDWGMALDVPLAIKDNALAIRSANVQRLNTDLMLREKSDSLQLINIIHGMSQTDVATYRGIVETDKIDRLAIGGGYRFGALKAVDRVLEFVLDKHKYKHYHILGVTNILHMILYMRIAAKGLAPFITSDSSTHLQNAITKGYQFQPFIQHQFKPYDIGDMTNAPSIHNHLPCSCPVCSTIKYADVLRILSGQTPTFIMMMHNLFATNRYVDSMYDAVSNCTTPELKSLLNSQFRSRDQFSANETIRGLHFIDLVCEEGLEKARKKFSIYLKGLDIDIAHKRELDIPGSWTSRESSTPTVNKEAYYTRVNRILSLYEKWHAENA